MCSISRVTFSGRPVRRFADHRGPAKSMNDPIRLLPSSSWTLHSRRGQPPIGAPRRNHRNRSRLRQQQSRTDNRRPDRTPSLANAAVLVLSCTDLPSSSWTFPPRFGCPKPAQPTNQQTEQERRQDDPEAGTHVKHHSSRIAITSPSAMCPPLGSSPCPFTTCGGSPRCHLGNLSSCRLRHCWGAAGPYRPRLAPLASLTVAAHW